MLVCVKNMVTMYGTEEVRLFAWRSHVSERHPIALANPGCFVHAEGTGHVGRERVLGVQSTAGLRSPAPPPTPRAKRNRAEPWRIIASSATCRTSERSSPIRVRLSTDAREQIMAVLNESDPERETGGCLFGLITDGLVEVLGASGPGPQAERSRHAYRPDRQHDMQTIERAEAAGLEAVGEFHSHCNYETGRGGVLAPSATDLRAFSGQRQLADADCYLAIVAARDDDAAWRLQAWTVRAGAGDQDRAELVASIM
jgi:proteasome lid subunit RPN8/RPN11